MRRWGDRESTGNRKQSVLRVKGQPPESVNAVTVGTDQSQCLDSIDQTLAHARMHTHFRKHYAGVTDTNAAFIHSYDVGSALTVTL